MAEKVMEHYLIPWTIEVFFKESKQYKNVNMLIMEKIKLNNINTVRQMKQTQNNIASS